MAKKLTLSKLQMILNDEAKEMAKDKKKISKKKTKKSVDIEE